MSAKRGFEQLLLRPFDAISAVPALVFGLATIIATALVAGQAGLQTRGILELQFIPGGSSASLLLQGFINWLSLTLALLILGRWLQPQPFPVLPLIANQAAARWPLLLSSIYLSIPALGSQIRELTLRLTEAMPSEPGQVMADAAYMGDALVLTLLGVPLLVFLIWMVWLMFHGYQVATTLSGPRAVFSFVGALAGAYILSKILIAQIF